MNSHSALRGAFAKVSARDSLLLVGEVDAMRVAGQVGYAEALVVGGGNVRLERIASLIDCVAVDALQALPSGLGLGQPYSPLAMVKVLLPRGWYDLGDPTMEEAPGDRLHQNATERGCSLDPKLRKRPLFAGMTPILFTNCSGPGIAG